MVPTAVLFGSWWKPNPVSRAPPAKTFRAVPDDRDAMSEAEEIAVPDGMIDRLLAKQGLEVIED